MSGDGTIEVAPREISDLVYHCCRVSGLDAGSSTLVADNVTDAEILGEGAAADFVALAIVGPYVGTDRTMPTEGAGQGPVPDFRAAVSQWLDPSRRFRRSVSYREKRRAAMSGGLRLHRPVFVALQRQAARILVAEIEIDAAVDAAGIDP